MAGQAGYNSDFDAPLGGGGLVSNRNDPRTMMALRLMQQQMPDQIQGKGATYATALGGIARALASAKLLGDVSDDRDTERADEATRRASLAQEAQDFMRDGAAPAIAAPGAAPAIGAPGAAPAPSQGFSPVASAAGGAISPPPDLMPHYEGASKASNIPVPLLIAQGNIESGFRPDAKGGGGENGIAQVLPSTGANPGYGVPPISPEDARDPAKAIPWQAQYLAARGKAAGVTDWNDPEQAARGMASYNGAGPQAAKYGARVMADVPRVQVGAPPMDKAQAMADRLTPEGVARLDARAAAAAASANPLISRQAPMLAAQARSAQGALDRQDLAGQRSADRAEAAQVRADATREAQDARVPQGYRWNNDHTAMEVVPGGPAATKAAEATPAFGGTGMEQQSASVMHQLGPKISNGTATDDEQSRYALAFNHMSQGNIQMVPDPKDPTGKTMVLARIPGNIPAGFPAPRTQAAPSLPAAAGGAPAAASDVGPPTDPRAPQIVPGTARPDKDGTEAERVAAGFADRMAQSNKLHAALATDGYGSMSQRDYLASGLGSLGNYAMSAQGQQYQQAAQAWVRAKLRKESGAAIGKDEMAQEIATYFPKAGDGAEVIAQKAAGREAETVAMRKAAGRAYGMADPATLPSRTDNASAPVSTPASAPDRSRGVQAIEQARRALGPNASDDDVVRKAREMLHGR